MARDYQAVLPELCKLLPFSVVSMIICMPFPVVIRTDLPQTRLSNKLYYAIGQIGSTRIPVMHKCCVLAYLQTALVMTLQIKF